MTANLPIIKKEGGLYRAHVLMEAPIGERKADLKAAASLLVSCEVFGNETT